MAIIGVSIYLKFFSPKILVWTWSFQKWKKKLKKRGQHIAFLIFFWFSYLFNKKNCPQIFTENFLKFFFLPSVCILHLILSRFWSKLLSPWLFFESNCEIGKSAKIWKNAYISSVSGPVPQSSGSLTIAIPAFAHPTEKLPLKWYW